MVLIRRGKLTILASLRDTVTGLKSIISDRFQGEALFLSIRMVHEASVLLTW